MQKQVFSHVLVAIETPKRSRRKCYKWSFVNTKISSKCSSFLCRYVDIYNNRLKQVMDVRMINLESLCYILIYQTVSNFWHIPFNKFEKMTWGKFWNIKYFLSSPTPECLCATNFFITFMCPKLRSLNGLEVSQGCCFLWKNASLIIHREQSTLKI